MTTQTYRIYSSANGYYIARSNRDGSHRQPAAEMGRDAYYPTMAAARRALQDRLDMDAADALLAQEGW